MADADLRSDWEVEGGYLLASNIASPQEALACPRSEIHAATKLELALGHWWSFSAATVAASATWQASEDVVRSAKRVHSLLADVETRRDLEGSWQMLELSMLQAESARAMGDFDSCRRILTKASDAHSDSPWFRAISGGLDEKSRDPRKIAWTQERPPAPGLWQRMKGLLP